MINKKLLGVVALTALGVAGLASCATGPDLTLTVWAPSSDAEYVNAQIAKFKEANPTFVEEGRDIKILAAVSEGEIQDKYGTDFKAGAEIAFAADDNIRNCADGGYIQALDADTTARLVARDGQEAVDAGTINGKAYGYPYRGDNGYVLYVDSSIVTDEDAKSIEGIVAACRKASAKFYFPLRNAWYTPCFLFAVGGEIEVGTDGKIHSNFNSPECIAGLEAMNAILDGATDVMVTSGDDIDPNAVLEGLSPNATTKTGAAIMWNDYERQYAANENVKPHALPTYTVDGEAHALKSFLGYKHVVVREEMSEEESAWAHKFAEFISDYDAQKTRYEELGHGGTNLKLAGDTNNYEDVPHLQILNEMKAAGNTVPQGVNVTSAFWDPCKNVGVVMCDNTTGWGTYESAQQVLDALVTSDGWVEME